MIVTNSVSIFEFESCVSLAIEWWKSFEYEIPVYRNFNPNETFDTTSFIRML